MAATLEPTFEVLEERQRDRLTRWRKVRRRKTTSDGVYEDTVMDRLEQAPIELIEDRWDGLVCDGSKLQQRLDRLLIDLSEGLTRRDIQDTVEIDGQLTSADVVMLEGIQEWLRTELIRRARMVAL